MFVFLQHLVRRPVAVSMIYLVILTAGLASLWRLPLELMPGVDYPRLTVTASWPGTTPETMEALVTSPIEAVCNTVKGVRKVSSVSKESYCRITLEFGEGTDMDFSALELNEKLSLVRQDLPATCQPPRISKYVPKEFETGDFMSYHLAADLGLVELRQIAIEQIRGALLSVPGVAEVEVRGGLDPVIEIELDATRLSALQIGPQEVSRALHDAQLQVSAGTLQRHDQRLYVRIDHRIESLSALQALPIVRTATRHITLDDIGRVRMTTRTPYHLKRIDGQPAVELIIHKQAGENTIAVADRIYERVERLQSGFKNRMRLLKVRDSSTRIRQELGDLSWRALFALAIVWVVLLLFLRQWRAPVIILSTIFFAVMMTFIGLWILNATLNILTLAGLALGFGMLVDNSIVVLDNIQRHRQQGESPHLAASRGTAEMIMPVVAATLTTLVALLPFLTMSAETRLYYWPFSVSVGLALVSSLLVAFTWTPTLTTRLHLAAPPSRSLQRLNNGYLSVLDLCLRFRKSTVLVVLLLAVAAWYIFDRYVEQGPIWQWHPDTYVMVYVGLPQGNEIGYARDIARSFEEVALAVGQSEKIETDIYAEQIRMRISFDDTVAMTATPFILKEKLIARAAGIGGAITGVHGFGQGFSSGGGGSAPSYRFKIKGYDYVQVTHIAQALGRRLQRYPRVADIRITSSRWFSKDLYELILTMDRERLSAFDLSVRSALIQIQPYLRETLNRQRLTIQGHEHDMQIKMAGANTFDLLALQDLMLYDDNRSPVRLSDVATLERQLISTQIEREDQQYTRTLAFEFRGPFKLGNRLVDSILKTTQLPPGYKLESQRWLMPDKEKREILWVILLALVLVFMVTAGLYESLIHPFVVMLTVPMALIGVSVAYWLSDTSFDRGAYIGVVLLSGIVVNNAILLVSQIRQEQWRGTDLLTATRQAAQARLRPILMTSATTILALLPLITSARPGSTWDTLALSTVGGLASSTLLVLLVTPVLVVMVGGRE